ncbi:atlastin isoform X2 [Bombyx mori]|uniref:GB1/RHD3-type G domain-containing protein n=1 Tax=Bombyx mori TaxID=7091 RepID=A0A8R2HST4_BOMMO|nr:atlastin [Bombyx mori]
MSGPRCVQVVNRNENHNYVLEDNALQRILLREDVKDLPLMVVSVVGAYRGGKSFLLNYFLRYLNSPTEKRNENGDWLGNETDPLVGFSWKGGFQRHTTGILMYSEPFITTTATGEKVAVLLMDTPGLFDPNSTVRDSSIIFALSTLISSVQIYNLIGNLQEDDLQWLQLFTEYGKLLKNEDGSKAFQMLMFLIRDWFYPYEHAFGAKGGAELLKKKLEITDKMPKELCDLREHIRSCFDKVSCFLMPHPGFNFSNPSYNGNFSELSADFRDALKELVPSIFTPENLNIKKINGVKITCADLYTYFQTYINAFNTDSMITPSSIFENTKRAALTAATREATSKYTKIMDSACNTNTPSMPGEGVRVTHNQALDKAIEAFNKKGKLGSQKEIDAYLTQLKRDLEEQLPRYGLMNDGKYRKLAFEAKEVFDNTVKAVHGENLFCLHPNDVEPLFNEAVLAAVTYFDSKRQKIPNVFDEEKIKFIQCLGKELKFLQALNLQNNRHVVTELKMNFSSFMEGLVSKDPPLDDNEYEVKYQESYRKAIETFNQRRNRPTEFPEDVFKLSLMQHMPTQFTDLKEINRSKNRKQFMLSLSFYVNYMSLFWDPDTCCLHPNDLVNERNLALEQALKLFHPELPDDMEREILKQFIKSKYDDLRELNDAANETAIASAVNVYIEKMDKATEFKGWWVPTLGIPYIVNLANRSSYHEEAKKAVLLNFYSNRRDRMNSAPDKYYNELIKEINYARMKY